MSHRLIQKSAHHRLIPVFLANFFFSLHYNVLVYVNSSYLGRLFNPGVVSFLYVLGSLLSILVFIISIKLQNYFGNRKFFSFFIFLELLAVAGLALASTQISTALLFIIFSTTSIMIIYSLDIFLEDVTQEKETGSVRGIYLTLGNLALVLSPLMISIVAPTGEFTHLYVVSALFLLPLFLISALYFTKFKDGVQRHPGLPIKSWLHTPNIRRVTTVRFVLEMFYAFMVIYMPIYLHGHIGFTWTQISFIFSIMLLPFILFEIPVGRLADKWCGEKEIMTLGLFIIGIVLLIIPFIKSPNIFWWAGLLFCSRVGASLVEVTCESYFFKHVDKRDKGMISIYRLNWPVAFIIGPIIGAFSLALFPFEAMFLILAVIIFKSMDTSTKLRDTL